MSFLSVLFGTDDSNAAERILERSARPDALATKAVGNITGGRSVTNDAAEAFLRGLPIGNGSATLSEPMARSGWVMRAIKHVAEPIAGVPLQFSVPTAEGARALVNPTLASFWQAPAIGPEGPLSRSDVLEATVGWMKLCGEAFWVFGDDILLPRIGKRAGSTPEPFFIARPDQMREVMSRPNDDGKQGTLLGWQFRDTNGRDWPLLPAQVYHPKFFNPYDPVRGLGEYQAAAVAAMTDVAAGEFVRNLMAGNGDRGPIVGVKEGAHPITTAQMTQIERAIKEKAMQARAGILKPLFLSADVSVSDPQVQKPDSDFVAQRIESRKEIYLIFGVPASLAEPKAHYSIGAASDRYILIEDTCKPLATKLAFTIGMISQRILGMSGTGLNHLIATLDFEQHSVMLQARTERIKSWADLCARGMPPALAGEYLAMRLPEFDGDDVGFLPLAMQTMEDALAKPPAPAPTGAPNDPPEDDDGPTETDDSDTGKMLLALLSKTAPEPLSALLLTPGILDAPPPETLPASDPVASKDPLAAEKGDTDPAREELWNRHMKLRRPGEKKMQKAVRRVLFNARSVVLAKLESTARKAAPPVVQKDDDDDKDEVPTGAHPGTALDVIFDPVSFTAELINATSRVSRVQMQIAGDEVRQELGIDDPWTMPAAETLNALRERTNLLKNTSQEVFDEVKTELEAGFQAGETTAQLADRVRAKFRDLENGRAETIAVTETGAAYGTGRAASATAAGCKTKSWLSAHDKRVRPTHRAADGQSIKADGAFAVGADHMLTPCTGSTAEENSGCRCVVLFHV